LIEAPAERFAMAERARELVDGLGARRVALRMLSDTLRLRAATPDDASLIHRWRNHPATRAVSRQTDPIDFEAHQQWMTKVLADERRLLFVAQVGGIPVGVVRLDKLDSHEAEVSLFLDPSLHGLGLGTALLRSGEAQAPRLGVAALRATVLPDNAASRRLFESAGYRFDANEGRKAVPPSIA
jgi:RimJ/RimL family protein N-acetyltransferase